MFIPPPAMCHLILQRFVDHPNIISLLNVLKADNDKDIYLVFDHMDTDLFNARKILKPPHLPYIMYGRQLHLPLSSAPCRPAHVV